MIKEELSCGTVCCQTNLDQGYWDNQWQKKEIGCGIGYSSPAIAEYILQYPNKEGKILIPGCGTKRFRSL